MRWLSSGHCVAVFCRSANCHCTFASVRVLRKRLSRILVRHITAAGVASAPAATSCRQIRGKHMLCFICVLLVGVEINTGPTRRATRPTHAAGARNITIGALDARSAEAHKAAEIHLTIEDERPDVLAISET